MDRLKQLINRKPNRWGNLSIKEFEADITTLQKACRHLVTRHEYVDKLEKENADLKENVSAFESLWLEEKKKNEQLKIKLEKCHEMYNDL